MSLLEYTGNLIVTRCWCGIQHAVPESLYNLQLGKHRDGRLQDGIYCPLGHTWTFAGEGRAAAMERQLVSERARHDQTRAELRETESRRRAEKGAKTKIKNRIAAGLCPCCNRSFQNLARHMAGQHPDFTTHD